MGAAGGGGREEQRREGQRIGVAGDKSITVIVLRGTPKGKANFWTWHQLLHMMKHLVHS